MALAARVEGVDLVDEEDARRVGAGAGDGLGQAAQHVALVAQPLVFRVARRDQRDPGGPGHGRGQHRLAIPGRAVEQEGPRDLGPCEPAGAPVREVRAKVFERLGGRGLAVDIGERDLAGRRVRRGQPGQLGLCRVDVGRGEEGGEVEVRQPGGVGVGQVQRGLGASWISDSSARSIARADPGERERQGDATAQLVRKRRSGLQDRDHAEAAQQGPLDLGMRHLGIDAPAGPRLFDDPRLLHTGGGGGIDHGVDDFLNPLARRGIGRLDDVQHAGRRDHPRAAGGGVRRARAAGWSGRSARW